MNVHHLQDSDVRRLCYGQYSMDRADTILADLAELDVRVDNNPNFFESPEWNSELMRIEQELKEVVPQIFEECF